MDGKIYMTKWFNSTSCSLISKHLFLDSRLRGNDMIGEL